MPLPARRLLYALPALVATLVTMLLALLSLLVGPIQECEECPGRTGASQAQTQQWLWALRVSAAAVFLAWAVAAVVIVATSRDGRRLRAVPMAIALVVALIPAGGAEVAVAINVYNAVHPAGYRS
ncbi:MAG TPA: hypothetical protein VGJ07_24965 [Rugosimonospora sp.]|jgi:hypothetical protein